MEEKKNNLIIISVLGILVCLCIVGIIYVLHIDVSEEIKNPEEAFKIENSNVVMNFDLYSEETIILNKEHKKYIISVDKEVEWRESEIPVATSLTTRPLAISGNQIDSKTYEVSLNICSGRRNKMDLFLKNNQVEKVLHFECEN